jgi:uncharacterized RDD family membrane protein YckC
MIKKQTLHQPSDTSREHELTGAPLASFTRRAFALIIDFLIAGMVFMLLTYLIGNIGLKWGLISPEKDVLLKFTFFRNWYSVIWLVLYFMLNVYFSNGLTIGKWICRIRIVSLVHRHIGLWQSLERALGYGASALEAGFGFLQYFLRKDRPTVHDRIAETIVVYNDRVKQKTNELND